MIDIYTECQPHGSHHPVEPIEHLKMVGAQYYTSLLSKLTSHINNTDVHVTNEDKVKWEKAFLDIKDLKDKVDDIDTSGNKDHTIDLDAYATKTWVESQGYAYKNQTPTYQDLQQYATIMYVDNAIKNIVIPEGDWVTEDELNRATTNLATLNDVNKVEDDLGRDIHNLEQYCENTYLKKSEAGQQYELPTATNDTKGGFIAGHAPSGQNNYPVRMSGDYAYVNIPLNLDGQTIEMTEVFDVEVVQCSLRVEYDESLGIQKTVGDIDWRVTSTIGSQRAYVAPSLVNEYDEVTGEVINDISAEATFLPGNLPLSVVNRGITWHAQADRYMSNQAYDYVAITVKRGNDIVAKQLVSIAQEGQKGDSAQQYIPYAMIRLCGEYDSDREYHNGDIQNGDIRDDYGCVWMDVVSYNDIYYRALKNGRLGKPVIDGNENVAEWSRFAMFGDAAFNAVIANYLNARSITAEQIVILEDYDSTNPIPVAGIVGKNTYEYNGQEYDLIRRENGNDDNPIVIFAGSNSGNITNSPFRVYKDGSLIANNAKLNGEFVVGQGLDTIEMAIDSELGKYPRIIAKKDDIDNHTAEFSSTKITVGSAAGSTQIYDTTIHTGTVYADAVIASDIISTTDLNVNGNIVFNGQSIGTTWIYFDGNNGNLLLHFVGGILTETFFGGGETFNIIPRGEQYYIMNGIDDISFLTKS